MYLGGSIHIIYTITDCTYVQPVHWGGGTQDSA
jgi:hypothetical protein